MCVYIHIAHIHHIIIYYVFFFSYLLEASLYETNDLGVARDLWFMARDSPPLTQAVPSGGRSFLIETATVLVCMSWPYGEFRNGQRSLKKLEFPRQKRQWLRTWKCEYIYIYRSKQHFLRLLPAAFMHVSKALCSWIVSSIQFQRSVREFSSCSQYFQASMLASNKGWCKQEIHSAHSRGSLQEQWQGQSQEPWEGDSHVSLGIRWQQRHSHEEGPPSCADTKRTLLT